MSRPDRSLAPRALALGALLLATSACNDGSAGPDRPAQPAARETQLIATASGRSAANDAMLVQAISAALAGSVSRSVSLRIAAPGVPSADITYGGLTCTYHSDTGWFTCPEATLQSMTISAEFALFDAAGATQSAYDDATTASAEVHYHARGTLVDPDGAASIDRERTLTVTHLEDSQAPRIFAGTGTNTASGTVPDNAAQHYVLTDVTTAENVEIANPFSTNVWPLGGRLITDSQLDIDESGTHISTTRRHVIITFNGTQFVPMDVDGTVYTLDLGTGDLTSNP